ncbi:EAL and HDOD domain-containing protein [Desulfofustis glycolicus]|uniref:EAL and modified HD-GYP domain-containing signal transduction protein n=1 Tax=Desulfofustis glycolicus DSM 9705 TaxID=1121409 RepID=A0A1M5WWV3_9BACT|nr:HDOD domain-containing protein [Desulfofustis glycolicus]MCB2214495.1 EAL domain-containing protein [Desulfobulbaceae bacterium]SHH91882.1 EAL and modified HD-GYP domain-containing signal transduction protein [Desulfofustis glycolicus DSM 9705]
MDVFVARQPIFTRKKKLFGYELLFRSGMNNAFPELDGDVATSNLLSSSFFSVGIDRIAGGRKSFINFTEALLLRGTPALFPQEMIMVEILEDIRPSAEIIRACRSLKSQGYTLALDDFTFDDSFAELLPLIDIVKIDFRQTPQAEIRSLLDHLRPFSCRLLAEKIESYAEFNRARDTGFDLFQGYFFSRPEVLKNKDIPQNKLTMLRLISEINRSEFDVSALEKLISRDVAVSYKLLKYLNSAYFSRLAPLKSIRQAIAFLGERGVKLFVSLVATSQLAEDKPDELVRMSIIRARFLEQLGPKLGLDGGELFLLGLFSLIDAMLDNTMDDLVGRLPVSEAIRRALVERSGPLAAPLSLIESCERADWSAVDRWRQQLQVDEERLSVMQLDAIDWADSYET